MNDNTIWVGKVVAWRDPLQGHKVRRWTVVRVQRGLVELWPLGWRGIARTVPAWRLDRPRTRSRYGGKTR
ncbi:MAG: hypothetical protein JXD18_14930 [Anaerolineae bacterium]|nr:hypothetical protein [Anaerolineae bacterium]